MNAQNNDDEDPFAGIKEIAAKPIEDVSAFCKFIQAFKDAGIDVSYLAEPISCKRRPVWGEEGIVDIAWLYNTLTLAPSTWRNYEAAIEHANGVPSSLLLRKKDADYALEYYVNCIVTGIEWEKEDFHEILPTAAICHVRILPSELFNKKHREYRIMRHLSLPYSTMAKSIGRISYVSSERLVLMDYRDVRTTNLKELLDNEWVFDNP